MRFPTGVLPLLLLLVGFATTAAAQAETLVIVVRHAEKATAERDTELSEAGHARARALEATLADAGVQSILATERRRTQQTAQPLADRLGISIETVGLDATAEAHAASVAEVVRTRHAGRVVLVAGHSNTVPAIIAALGGPRLPDLCESEFSSLFVLRLREGEPARLVRARYGAEDGPLAGCEH
jgi:phosphohistidine phosphatase SixA